MRAAAHKTRAQRQRARRRTLRQLLFVAGPIFVVAYRLRVVGNPHAAHVAVRVRLLAVRLRGAAAAAHGASAAAHSACGSVKHARTFDMAACCSRRTRAAFAARLLAAVQTGDIRQRLARRVLCAHVRANRAAHSARGAAAREREERVAVCADRVVPMPAVVRAAPAFFGGSVPRSGTMNKVCSRATWPGLAVRAWRCARAGGANARASPETRAVHARRRW